MICKKLFITGGAGTLGRAIINRAHKENWNCDISIYSTDAMKHFVVKKAFPKVNSIIGDVRDYESLSLAIAGHDMVIHGAAVKHIPVSEQSVLDTISINVDGSTNVALACIRNGVRKCVGISTDKACSSHNAYGSTKYLLEKIFQSLQLSQRTTDFYLLRYGNVIESTGSVVEIWKNLASRGLPIKITNSEMTRFWLSPQQAVEHLLNTLKHRPPSVYIPLLPALSISKIAEYVAPDAKRENLPMRPGEKVHETLITEHENSHSAKGDGYVLLQPSLYDAVPESDRFGGAYSSDIARELSKDEFFALLNQAEELEDVFR